ncbi:autophagy-related protein 2 homolog A-like [Callorhinchus milii]|uniref:autophagy-related protein 2 homolog A-like n=1 Tax=Callorhinchus milii TaxID=7868 RepID=UPI001C3F508E|nr:autophagy-related protein 2 homolog A-like [Callorhinchus milii]
MMAWLPWPASLRERAGRYLLQRYLGRFLQQRLSLQQLSLDLYSGHGRLSLLQLQPQSLNEVLDSLGVPLEITDGFIDSISLSVPWSALMTENCTVEVTGLQLTCSPKYHVGKCTAPLPPALHTGSDP